MSEYFSEKRNKRKYAWFSAYILLYIIIFEFLVPAGKILPKPSLIIESVISLQLHYGLLINALYTISGIYIPMLLAYGLLFLLRPQAVGFLLKAEDFIESVKLLKYFGALSFITIYAFLSPLSNLSEMLFAFLISLMFMLNIIYGALHKVNMAYVEPFIALKREDSFLYKNIYWKSVQPELFDSFQRLNLYLWSIVLFFEFVKANLGIGNIYRLALSFKDLSGLVAISVLVALIVAISSWVIKHLNRKVIIWER